MTSLNMPFEWSDLKNNKTHLLKGMKIFEILDSIQIPDLKLDKSQARWTLIMS